MAEEDKLSRKDEILLEKYKLAAQIQDNYNNLFWYRTSVFFGIIAALFAAYGLVSTEIIKHDSFPSEVTPLIGVLVIFGVTGALLSWHWLRMHQRASYLQEYYRFCTGKIEECLKVEPDIFGKSYTVASEAKPTEETKQESDEKKKSVTLGETFVGEWKKTKGTVPGSLRKKLELVYLILFIGWSFLSLVGVLALLRTWLLAES